MRLPLIHIQQTPARLDIRSRQGQFHITQQGATIDIRTTRAVMDIKSEQPIVLVDMTKTWDALTGGKPFHFLSRIYNQSGRFVQQAIEETVREYDVIGDLTTAEHPIPELALQSFYRNPPKLQLYGEASSLNLSFEVQISKPVAEFTPGRVQVVITPSPPQIAYRRGGVQISMAQYPAVHFTAPQIDFTG